MVNKIFKYMGKLVVSAITEAIVMMLATWMIHKTEELVDRFTYKTRKEEHEE